MFDNSQLAQILSDNENCKYTNLYGKILDLIEGNFLKQKMYNEQEKYYYNLGPLGFSYSTDYNYHLGYHGGIYTFSNGRGNFYDTLRHLFKIVGELIENDNLDKFEKFQDRFKRNKLTHNLTNIFLDKCFYDTNCQLPQEMSYGQFKASIRGAFFSKTLEILDENNLEELFNVIKNGNKLLAVDNKDSNTYNNIYTNNLCLVSLEDISESMKSSQVKFYLMYLDCRECFHYYMKLIPFLSMLQNFKIPLEINKTFPTHAYINYMSFHNNLYDYPKLISYDNFTFHICKKNHIYELLTFISKVVEFSIPIEDIVIDVKSIGSKNAYSVI